LIKGFLFITLLLIVGSCQRQQIFDKAKWAEEEDLMTFPNRKLLLEDLTQHYQLKGKSYNDIIKLLGQPQYSLDSTMGIGYKIDEKYKSDIDPIYTKTLLFYFNKDTTVENYKIQEWKK
jgi:hypothetical protein